MPLSLYGIRHHGPGSARSVLAALQQNPPDVLLVEGPSDGEELLRLAMHEQMQPPVALLIYSAEEPKLHAFYPMAEFSPEWQAIKFCLARNIPVGFMDLPQYHRLAAEKQARDEQQANAQTTGAVDCEEAAALATQDIPNNIVSQLPEKLPEIVEAEADGTATGGIQHDPLSWLARAAGFTDTERWWEVMVEHRRDAAEMFPAILEALTALREQLPAEECARDLLIEEQREAWMRQTIRAAQKEFNNVAAVCGAWHTPALAKMPPASKDAALLKGLPKIKTQATWVPWTYSRLSYASGYGAGVSSPGWYDHLWSCTAAGENASAITSRWLTNVARLLRKHDLDASCASVIDSVRVAETLAAMRALAIPGLQELAEATQATLCFGDETPMRLIERELIVGERLGKVPHETPSVPLQQDLQRLSKRLRLPLNADSKVYDLDLRKENDLQRSHLLHRLTVLSIAWGMLTPGAVRAKGTFHEVWTLQWAPEFPVQLIEASQWGTTIYDAASARVRSIARNTAQLSQLANLVDAALLADLPSAVHFLMQRVQSVSAVTSDVLQLMDALPALAQVSRYGNVRRTDTEAIAHIVAGMVTRISLGLPLACNSLDDEAAEQMVSRIDSTDASIRMLQQEELTGDWRAALTRIAQQQNVNGLVAGRACRLLLEAEAISPDEAAREMSLALSVGNDPIKAGAWAAGFLQGSGMILLLDQKLWAIIDNWIAGLNDEAFTAMLPMLRRIFATFSAPERRQMGERVASQRPQGFASLPAHVADATIDQESARAVLPLLQKILFGRSA